MWDSISRTLWTPDHEGGQLTGGTNREMRQTRCSRFPPSGGNRCRMKK